MKMLWSTRACVRAWTRVLTVLAVVLTAAVGSTVRADEIEEQIVAKVYGVATKGRGADGQVPTPSQFPEWVPGNGTTYTYVPVTDWTSGFFAGTLWLLYQRSLIPNRPLPLNIASSEWLSLARTWTAPLKSQKDRTDTHDLGFMIFNSWGWQAVLSGDETARGVVKDAATALARRFNPVTKTIRSWGALGSGDPFQVIIDNMMNLEMLYWAGNEFNNATLLDIANTHADTTMANHFRSNYSTWHVVDYSQTTGAPVKKYTVQGYADWSTWTRGQAWAVYGYARAYHWTNNTSYLTTAQKAADLFLAVLPEPNAQGVPYWDFDAPLPAPRDTSAAMALASGLLHLVLADPAGSAKYLEPAWRLVNDTIALSQSPPATFTVDPELVVEDIGWESFLMNGTINNNPNTAHTLMSSNTGIVYANYYLIEAQNILIQMGLLA